MKYRFQLFLVFSLVFLAVLSEAKDKKKDKDDKKLKAKALELNVTGQNWPEPNDKQKDWLLDADHTKFLDKWQPLSDSEAKKLGPISKNNFSSEGICNKKYKCETITYGSIANIDKDVKNPAKKLKPIKMKQMDTFLEHLKKRKPIKLTHHIQKNSLLAAEIHHSGVVLRLTERNGKDISGEHAAALAFDAFKYMIMSSEPQAVRAMVAQPDNKPLLERSACIFPKGANRAQADNYCRGKDADPDEDDEKQAKSKKKDDDDSCPADGGKKDKQGKSLKDTGSKLLDLLKSMLGIKSDDKEKDGKKCKSDEKGDKKEKKEKKKGDKKKEEKKKKDGEKDGKKDDKKDKDDSESSGFELDQVIIKVSTKKSDKGKGEANDDLELDSEGETSKKKAKSAKKEASKSKSEDDESDELDVEHFFDEDGSSSKKKSKSSKKDKPTAKKSSSKKAKKVKADEDDENDEDDDFEDASKSKTKKKAGSFKQKSVSKKLAQKKASLKKAAKKQVAKLTKAEDDEADVEADFEESKKSGAKKKSSSKKKNIKKATSKKTDDDAAETKAEKTDSKLWARSAGSEAAYLGAEHMDHLYGRSNEFRYGQFPRQSQLNALRRRQQQQIIHGTALARRALEFEDSDLIARARMIREPMERREAEPEPEPEPEPKAQPEAQPEAIPKPEEKEGYLFSRAFFDDVNTLLTRQSPEFHEEAQGFMERSLGLDEAEEYYEW